ncbi:MAG: MFS transporter [Pseudomonadota bacterium]
MYSFTRPQWLTLAVCAAIFALGQFHRASGAIYAPILTDRFAASATLIGALVSAMFLANIAAQLPFGTLLDRFGARRVVPACLGLIAAGTALFAFAGNVEGVLAARIAIGIGSAAMGAASHVIIASAFPARDFGLVSGLVVTLGGIGGLLGTYPLAFALERLPWRVIFAAVAALTLALALAMPRLIAPQAAAPEAALGGFRALLALPRLRRALALAFVTYAPIVTVTGLWGGPYLQEVTGLGPEAAGAVLFFLFGATILGGLIYGVLDRRFDARRGLIGVSVGASITCLAVLSLWPAPPAALAIALLLGMVFAQQFYIPLGAEMRNAVPDGLLGRAASLFTLVAVAAIPVHQFGFGLVIDTAAAAGLQTEAQFRAGFGAMAALIALCAAAFFLPLRPPQD